MKDILVIPDKQHEERLWCISYTSNNNGGTKNNNNDDNNYTEKKSKRKNRTKK